MTSRALLPLAALAMLWLAGCSTPTPPPADSSTPRTPPALGPAAPVAPPADTRPATIKGSQESSALLDNFTAFIVAVDGQPAGAGRKGWNQPVTLQPGNRRLTVEFNRGVFLARTELKLDALPGAAYELRYASDAQVYGGHTYCEFWIVDLATGDKATDATRTKLDKLPEAG